MQYEYINALTRIFLFCFMGGNREYLLKEELMYFVKVELTLMSET